MPKRSLTPVAKPTPTATPTPAHPNPTHSPEPVVSSASSKKHHRYHFHWWHAAVACLLIIALGAIGVGWKFLQAGTNVFHGNSNSSRLSQLGKLIVPGDRELKNDGKGRTNILLVGHGGDGHDGPWLADTIIFASINQASGEVAMLSIPRDFLVNLPNYGYRKINNALAFGRTDENPTGGDALITKAVEEVTDQTIQYYGRVDFAGFKKAVDDIGGIDVTVDTAFTDYEYPTYNYGYQTIKFETGIQHFDGERALQFSRSRHGNNGEGSDFARSKRQQKLLFAFREKALSLGTLTSPGKISGLLDTLGTHVSSTLELWEVARIAGVIKDLSPDKIVTRVLETTTDSLVRAGTGTDGAYIIQPRLGLGNYQEIQELAANIFQLNAVEQEAAPVQIQNATNQTGLAETVGHTLRGFTYDIASTATVKNQSFEQSLILDLSNGKAPQTVAALQQKYGATVTTSLPPNLTLDTGKPLSGNYNVNSKNTTPQVILILGKSAISIVNSTLPPSARKLLPSST
jgi:polyisoprenyl-teichoic acid--peptidoglycan teichoic acid transferase